MQQFPVLSLLSQIINSHIVVSLFSFFSSYLSTPNSFKMQCFGIFKLHFSLEEQLFFIPVPYVSKQD